MGRRVRKERMPGILSEIALFLVTKLKKDKSEKYY